jgi:glycine betaine/proline transport system permease protein
MSVSSLFASAPDQPGFGDDAVLDEFTIPFGSWTEQAVNWTVLNLDWLLDAIAWPFEFLLDNVVDNGLLAVPWWVVVLAMFLLAWLVRNLSVAVGAAAGLVVCGLLGQEYWVQTARTIGLIIVAVVICVLVGIPIGVLAGRVDSVWGVLRPTLDAMQVIHSFVYLLPFIYFWGIGEVGSTMATMIFAVPPLIRLTNLGIRQVPEDVVEAARAYGAPELKVLFDVQLPLARPAILTGVNQTLLLAFSMLGVAAIMGAGGLGALLFRALSQQDVSLAASAGLAFFILAVVLDRIAQPATGVSNSLLSRMTTAWRARKAPEVLLDDADFNEAAIEEDEDDSHEGEIAIVGSGERTSIMVAMAGAVLMVVSIFLAWGKDASLLTGYSRRADQERPGESFSGMAAEGGSWFAYCLVIMAVVILLAGARVLTGRSGGRWLSPDGALFAAMGGLLVSVGYLITQPSQFTTGYSHGIGGFVAVVGAVVALVGAGRWVAAAPYSPRRPLRPVILRAPLVLAGVAVIMAVISMFSSWSLDERADAVITPEIQAQIDDLVERAEAGEIDPGVAATEIQVIRAQAEQAESIVIDGKSGLGSGLGIWTLVAAVLGAAAACVAAGFAGLGDRIRWIGGTVTMGFGVGTALIAVGWVGSLARATDPNFFSGVGSMIAMLVGLFLFVAGSSVIKGYERSRVYSDPLDQAAPIGGTAGPDAQGTATMESTVAT